MITPEILEKIKSAVHQPLNWDDYNSTNVQVNTNCFSHAIGSTVIDEPSVYRIGMMSRRKRLKQQYYSQEEVKELFLADMQEIGLELKEIPVGNVPFFLQNVNKLNFTDKEHLIALFVEVYGNQRIADFHFLRYDQNKGWSEKRCRNPVVYFENIQRQWPSSWTNKLVGVWKVRR